MAAKVVGPAATGPDDVVRKSELDAAIAGVSGGTASSSFDGGSPTTVYTGVAFDGGSP